MRIRRVVVTGVRRASARWNSTYVAAIDQGTSSSRVILYDAETLAPVPDGSHQVDLSSSYMTPQPGWAQMDPKSILSSVEQSAAGALAKTGITAAQVVGVGITNQRETIVVWDQNTGEPLYDAVLWLDNRTGETVTRLVEELGTPDALRAECGLPLSTYFTGVKLRWLMDNIPAVQDGLQMGTAMVGTIDSWLIWNLTDRAVHATDLTNASRTMMMDLQSATWSDSCLSKLGLQSVAGALPKITSCAERIGEISTGALAGCTITGSIGDQQSAMLGQGCVEVGMAKTTYGTGAFTLLNTGTSAVPSDHGLLSTALYKLGANAETWYALEGSVGSCGIGLNWFANKLKIVDSAAEISELAAEVSDTAGLYFVPAFGGILAPRWRDDARASMVGLTLAHERTHVARAALEGISFQVAEVIQSMVKDSNNLLTEMRVDGGGSMSVPMMQSQADLLGVPVKRPANVETTALGAARAAAIGAGNPDALHATGGAAAKDTVFESAIQAQERTEKFRQWEKAVQSCLAFGTSA